MEASKKAKELVDKYKEVCCDNKSKQYALIAVDEILDVIGYDYFLEKEWQEVKTEIEKL